MSSSRVTHHVGTLNSRIESVRTGEGVIILSTDQKKRPVVLAVAASRPGGFAVELGVGDGDLAGSTPTRNNKLTTDK